MLMHLPHPSGRDVPQVANPIRFSEAPISYELPPPLLDQHGAEILRELGYDEQGIATLRAAGAI
jgi:crotonobetainyl-CoA:carnitine CoA-transferase CaiB-like acyl-CoA transferase